MIYRVTARIESDLFVKKPFSLDWEGYELVLNSDGQFGKVVSLSISVRLNKFEKYMPLIDEKSEPIHFHFKGNPFTKEIIGLLQHLESVGGYLLDLRKLHWEYVKEEWLPENEEEKALLKLPSLERIQKRPPGRPRAITQEYLRHVLDSKDIYADMIIPLAFFREGRNDYDSHRFVNSFYNFYFFIEDLFGDGKSKNHQVMQKFKKSDTLRKAVNMTINLFTDGLSSNRNNELNKLLKGKPVTAENVIETIVMIRGNLHHFSQKSSLRKAHPFNQASFEPEAYLLMSICIMALTEIVSQRSPILGNLLSTTFLS